LIVADHGRVIGAHGAPHSLVHIYSKTQSETGSVLQVCRAR